MCIFLSKDMANLATLLPNQLGLNSEVKMKRLDIVKALDGAGLYDVLTGIHAITYYIFQCCQPTGLKIIKHYCDKKNG